MTAPAIREKTMRMISQVVYMNNPDITGNVARAFEFGAIICLILFVISYFLTTSYNQFVKGEVR